MSTSAVVYKWLHPVSADFSTAADWSPTGGPQVTFGSGPPVSQDTALFATGSAHPYTISGRGFAQNYQISGDRVTFDNFHAGQPFANLYVDDNAAVTVSATSGFDLAANDSLGGGIVYIDAGLLADHGAMIVGGVQVSSSGTLKLNGGLLTTNDSGSVTVAHGGLVQVFAGATLNRAGLALDGNLIVSGTGSTAVFVAKPAGVANKLNADGSIVVAHGAQFTADAQLLGKLDIEGGTATISGVGAGAFAGGNGTLTLSPDASLLPHGDTNDGTISATGGILHVTGTIAGTGSLYADAGATLELGASTAETITFKGFGAQLMLDKGIAASGLLSGFTTGDSIDLALVAVASLDFGYAGNTTILTAHVTGQPDIVLDINGHLTAAMIKPQTDTHSGTLLTDSGASALLASHSGLG